MRAAFFGVFMFCNYKFTVGKVFGSIGTISVRNITIHDRIQGTISTSFVIHFMCTLLSIQLCIMSYNVASYSSSKR